MDSGGQRPGTSTSANPLGISGDNIEMQRYTSSASGSRHRSDKGELPDIHVSNHSESSSVSSLDGGERQTDRYMPISPISSPRPYIPRTSVDFRRTTTSYGGTPLSRFKSDQETESLVQKRATEIAPWHIDWKTPATMMALFILGVAGAVAHHIFYLHLHGSPAVNQLEMIRYGTALAFFTKTTLVGSVIMSFRQRIWHTFRTRPMTIGSIDGLFSVTEDLTQFLKVEMVSNAKLATFMALGAWVIPIASILSPAALTTEIAVLRNDTSCDVATLNFTAESDYDFRATRAYPGYSLNYYNSTDVGGRKAGFFDYFDQASRSTTRLASISVLSQQPYYAAHAAEQACGAGWNCTYSISFKGPGYKCTELASGLDANTDELAAMGAPFNTSALAPRGENIFFSDVDRGEYSRPQMPGDKLDANGQPINPDPATWGENFGVLQTEPVLWIGHSVPEKETYPAGSPFSRWKTVQTPKIFKCEHYETFYNITFNVTEGTPHGKIEERTFLNRIINTTFNANEQNQSNPSLTAREELESVPLSNSGTSTPESAFVRPGTDPQLYKLTAAYHALGQQLRNFLRGDVRVQTAADGNVSYPLTHSDISESRLVNHLTSYPLEDLIDNIQSLYEDIIITLLSEPLLVIAQNTSVPCTKTRYRNIFQYHQEGLWIGYAIAVFVSFVFLVIGFWSIVSNGVASNTQFSRIVVTTRNPTIDRLSVGACLGSDPFPQELKETKLRFGVLVEDEEGPEAEARNNGLFGKIEHCSFGTVGETKPVVKGGVYAGLKKYRPQAQSQPQQEKQEESEKESEKEGLLSNYDKMD